MLFFKIWSALVPYVFGVLGLWFIYSSRLAETKTLETTQDYIVGWVMLMGAAIMFRVEEIKCRNEQ